MFVRIERLRQVLGMKQNRHRWKFRVEVVREEAIAVIIVYGPVRPATQSICDDRFTRTCSITRLASSEEAATRGVIPPTLRSKASPAARSCGLSSIQRTVFIITAARSEVLGVI